MKPAERTMVSALATIVVGYGLIKLFAPKPAGVRPDVNWITPNILLGHDPSPANVPWLVNAGITDVIDLRGEPRNHPPELGPQNIYAGTPISYHYVPMLDRGLPQPAQPYITSVEIMRSAIRRGGKVYVHCHAGCYRSPSVVYAYLRTTGMSGHDAWTLIHNARPCSDLQYVEYAERAVA